MPFVAGTEPADDGGTGTSTTGRGLVGETSQGGVGVWGESSGADGVHGISHSGYAGVAGMNDDAQGGAGIWGESQHDEGVHGISHSNRGGVAGYNDGTGPAVFGESTGTGVHSAGFFLGNVTVTGEIVTANADCAEEFDLSSAAGSQGAVVSAGTVVVFDEDGALRASAEPYDKRVAGVVSGAGDYKPGLILDRHDSPAARVPVALLGTVYCDVDADADPIEVGDPLTTSSRPGHAMRATDPAKAFGAVLGKALRSLDSGQGQLPVLVALR
jgi:hypothetical protein